MAMYDATDVEVVKLGDACGAEIRGVDPPVMLSQGGAQAARINEAGDLVEERALGSDVGGGEHRAGEHELPVQRQALALEEPDIEALRIVDQGEAALRGDELDDRGEVRVGVGRGEDEARRAEPQGRHLGRQVAVGRGDHPDIDLDPIGPAQTDEGVFLEHAHDLALGFERHVGDFVQFEHNVYKPWWSVRFCVAMRAVVHMIDSVGSIRDAEIMAPKNFNDGTINVFRYDVSISRMAAPGPMKIQVVGTYNCLGVTRLIYGDPLKIELHPAL